MLKSDVLATHLTGLVALLGSAWAMPNSPIVSLAIALLTGLTQAVHAYERVKGQATVSSSDLTATGVTQLFNAKGTQAVELPSEQTNYISGPTL